MAIVSFVWKKTAFHHNCVKVFFKPLSFLDETFFDMLLQPANEVAER